MKSSKLVTLLGSLTKIERREFDKFLHSQYFNQREDVRLLFQFLLLDMEQDDGSLAKEKAFSAIYPGKKYDEKQIRYTMSFLYGLLRQYLTQKELEANPIQQQLLTIKALRKRKVQKLFDAEWQATKKELDSMPQKNIDTHYYSYSLHNEQLLDAIAKSRSATPGFTELSKELTNFFLANVLHHACLSKSYQTIAKLNYTPELLPQVLEHVSNNDYSKVPAVLTYFHCYQMLAGEEALNGFRHLMEDIEHLGKHFTKHELKDLHILALNFCIRKVNEGHEDYKPELFKLYKSGLSNGVFLEDGQLSRFTYKNIVASGLGLNQFDWVKNFIEEHKAFLDKKYRQSSYCFNLALYHFKKEEYTDAMLLLQQVGTDDLLNNLNARRILLRIYYDLGEWEALHSLLDSFQNYIYRKKDLGYHREFYLNLIRTTRKLIHLDLHDKRLVSQLRSEIESKENVYEKTWLLEKLGA